jgi:hypothetical protein
MSPGLQKGKPHKPGAGRPKLVDHFARRTVYLDQQHVDLVNRHRQFKSGGSFSEALRAILDTFRESHGGYT